MYSVLLVCAIYKHALLYIYIRLVVLLLESVPSRCFARPRSAFCVCVAPFASGPCHRLIPDDRVYAKTQARERERYMREDRVHGISFLGKQFLQDPLVLRPAALPKQPKTLARTKDRWRCADLRLYTV